MIRVLYVLDHPRFYPLCRQDAEHRGCSDGDYAVFCPQITSHEIPDQLKPSMLSAPVLSVAERSRIDAAAEKMAGEWHQIPEVRHEATYGTLNLAEMLEHGMDYFFVWVLRQWTVTKKLWESTEPETVVIARETGYKGTFSAPLESCYGAFFERVARDRGIPVEVLAEVTVPVSGGSAFGIRPGSMSKVVAVCINIVANILMTVRSKPLVAALASPKVLKPLLSRPPLHADWAVVMFGPAPKTFLKLLAKGVPSFCVQPSTVSPPQVDASAWQAIDRALKAHPSLTFDGVNVAEAARMRFESIFRSEIPALRPWADAFERFFKSRRVNAALLDEDVTVLHRLFVQVAALHRVPSCVVQHAITGHRRGFAPSQSTAIAAWGEVSRNQMVGWGIPAERIHLTGCASLKKPVASGRQQRRAKTLASLRLPEGHKMALFAPCRLRTAEHGFLCVKMSREQNAHFLRSVVVAMGRFPETSLVIKLHPGENEAYAMSLLRQEPALDLSRVRMVLNHDLHALLEAADVLVSMSSTVSIEAMAQDIPIVDLNLFEMVAYVPYGDCDAVAAVRTQEELERAIGRSLSDPDARREERKKFVEAYCGPAEGDPADRVRTLLGSLSFAALQPNKENVLCASC